MRTQDRVLVEGQIIAWCAGAFAAGTVFVIAYFADLAAFGFGAIFLTILSMPFALLVGAIPLAVAVVCGGWLDARRPLFRRPLSWGVVGLVAGAMIAPAVASIVRSPARASMVTGAVVVLIARRFVAWIDPIAPAPSGT